MKWFECASKRVSSHLDQEFRSNITSGTSQMVQCTVTFAGVRSASPHKYKMVSLTVILNVPCYPTLLIVTCQALPLR